MQILASLTKTTYDQNYLLTKISTHETSAVYVHCWSFFQVPQESVSENSSSLFEGIYKNIF